MAGEEPSPTEQLSDGRRAYSARGAATVLGVSDETMRRWVQTGRAPGEIRDAGGKRFFTVDASWVEARKDQRARAAAPVVDPGRLVEGMDTEVLELLNRAQESSERAELRADALRWQERAAALERRVAELERQLDAALRALSGLVEGLRGSVEPGR